MRTWFDAELEELNDLLGVHRLACTVFPVRCRVASTHVRLGRAVARSPRYLIRNRAAFLDTGLG